MSDRPLSPPPPYVEHDESQRPPPLAARPPPLPARTPPSSSSFESSGWSSPRPSHYPPPSSPHLHPYADPAAPTSSTALFHDPRSSSQASILPPEDGFQSGKRTLLLVYIHGFMGNETSFQSFPAHLHNLLSVTIGSSEGSNGYLVHTKVYPKFKTRHQIGVATLEFSNWLREFENETTDIVLIGHSMGGILAAEVVLLQSLYSPGTRRHPGILGVVAFDSPFLGMHPGIISSGIASLFRHAPTPPPPAGTTGEGSSAVEQELDPLFSQQPQRNFTIVPSQEPGSPWESTMRFIGKHHENLTQATGKYLMSHLEFGACLADPIGLNTRYTKIRRLEDGEQLPNGTIDRVRFANYYTISYGCEKAGAVAVEPPLPAEMAKDRNLGTVEPGIEAAMLQKAADGGGEGFASVNSHSRTTSGSSMRSMCELSPGRPSTASSWLESSHSKQHQHKDSAGGATSLSDISESERAWTEGGEIRYPPVEVIPPTPISPAAPDNLEAEFPPLSSPPTAPPLQEIPESADKHLHKALEKENKRLQKEYERQLKEHAKLVQGRAKAIACIREGREKERVKAMSIAEKQRQREMEECDEEKKDKGESERLGCERWQQKEEHDGQKQEQDCQKQEQDRQKQERDRQKQEQDSQKQERDRQRQIQKEEQERRKQIQKAEQDRQKQEQDSQKQERDRQRQIQKEEHERRKQIQKEEQERRKQIQKEEQDRRKQIRKEEQNRRKQIQKEEQQQQREQRQRLKKPPRQRKFCIIPSHPDKTWTPVEMKGVDEVGAHCGLFFVGEVYAKLVGDVAGRIEEWVGEEQTRRSGWGGGGGDYGGSEKLRGSGHDWY